MTINEIQNQIITELSGIGDWLDKYQYLIDLGKKLVPVDEKFKNEKNALQGCQSQVWIFSEIRDKRVRYAVDSDSTIIKGILILLLRVLDNQSPDDIKTAHLYFVEKTGLITSLSPSRANGLAAIIRRMQMVGD